MDDDSRGRRNCRRVADGAFQRHDGRPAVSAHAKFINKSACWYGSFYFWGLPALSSHDDVHHTPPSSCGRNSVLGFFSLLFREIGVGERRLTMRSRGRNGSEYRDAAVYTAMQDACPDGVAARLASAIGMKDAPSRLQELVDNAIRFASVNVNTLKPKEISKSLYDGAHLYLRLA